MFERALSLAAHDEAGKRRALDAAECEAALLDVRPPWTVWQGVLGRLQLGRKSDADVLTYLLTEGCQKTLDCNGANFQSQQLSAK